MAAQPTRPESNKHSLSWERRAPKGTSAKQYSAETKMASTMKDGDRFLDRWALRARFLDWGTALPCTQPKLGTPCPERHSLAHSLMSPARAVPRPASRGVVRFWRSNWRRRQRLLPQPKFDVRLGARWGGCLRTAGLHRLARQRRNRTVCGRARLASCGAVRFWRRVIVYVFICQWFQN